MRFARKYFLREGELFRTAFVCICEKKTGAGEKTLKNKAIFIIFLILSAALVFASCSDGAKTDGAAEKESATEPVETEEPFFTIPDGTELEFWLTEDVGKVDFSGYDEVSGWFGAHEYLGNGYKCVKDEDGNNDRPDVYVSYLVTAYPDYADGGRFVTSITVADPNVRFCGLTTGSSLDEFAEKLGGYGFECEKTKYMISESEEGGMLIARKGKITLQFRPGESVFVRVNVENRNGIVF